ncbi:MAG TPA: hypothetical protein VHN99_07120 [Deinococcales bacterium]|nr:hypothetical protein [Deinococcales bacterium]
MTEASPPQWQFGQLRLTVFPKDPLTEAFGRDFWSTVIRHDPQSEFRQKVGLGFIYQTEGIDGPAQLVLRVEPQRIDWLCNPVPGDVVPLATIGTEADALPLFEQYSVAVLENLHLETARIALGVALVLPVASKEDGYRWLSRYLPKVEVDPVGSRDFLYRINRPRPSQVAPVELNRLSEWSVMRFDGGFVSFNAIGLQAGPSIASQYSVRLVLDISSAPETDLSSAIQKLEPVFREMMALSQEIWTSGDIA